MSLSAPRVVFGIHSISPYARDTRLPYGILKVLGSGSLTLSSSVEELFGGSQRFSWAAESKTFKAALSAKVKAYPGFLFTQFMGGTNTDNAAEALASCTAIANAKGTSVFAAVTGIASVGVTVGDEKNVKFASYVAVATDATHVDVYAYSDVDFPRGTNPAAFINDALKITSAPIVITTGATVVAIPKTGLSFTGGSGAIAMVAGDTAYFDSRPENSGSSDISIGPASTALPAFGAMILAQKRADASLFEARAHNIIAEGFPIPMDEMAFSNTELKATCIYDSVQDEVIHLRAVNPLTFK